MRQGFSFGTMLWMIPVVLLMFFPSLNLGYHIMLQDTKLRGIDIALEAGPYVIPVVLFFAYFYTRLYTGTDILNQRMRYAVWFALGLRALTSLAVIAGLAWLSYNASPEWVYYAVYFATVPDLMSLDFAWYFIHMATDITQKALPAGDSAMQILAALFVLQGLLLNIAAFLIILLAFLVQWPFARWYRKEEESSQKIYYKAGK